MTKNLESTEITPQLTIQHEKQDKKTVSLTLCDGMADISAIQRVPHTSTQQTIPI